MKRALVVLAVVAGVLALAALLAYHSLDVIVRAALEHWGPDVTGVKVTVAEVALSPRDWDCSMRSCGSVPRFTFRPSSIYCSAPAWRGASA